MQKIALLIVACFLVAGPASAQQLKLDIKDGRVNLDATSVPVRQILAEWARVGTTKMVGADKITGAPVTLKLVDVPERQALDIILRSVAGYMAAPRALNAAQGASVYDRVVIMATSSVPATATTGGRPNAPGAMSGVDRRIAPRPPTPRPAEVESDEPPGVLDEDSPDTGVPNQPVFTFPQPQQQGNQVFVPVPEGGFVRPGQPGAVQAPVIQFQPNPSGQPTIYNFVPSTGAPAPPPNASPFQVIGSPTPGVIQPVPQPAQPAPGVPPKPPGGF